MAKSAALPHIVPAPPAEPPQPPVAPAPAHASVPAPVPLPVPAEAAPPEDLLSRLSTLRSELKSFEQRFAAQRRVLDPSFQQSASNLLHYVELRRHDLRKTQVQLTELGLSSLGRSEANVMATLDAVVHALQRIAGLPADGESAPPAPHSFQPARDLTAEHAQRLLGPPHPTRRVRIMVTLGADLAEDYSLVQSLVKAGMDCARVNCAHDTPAVWRRLVEQVHRAGAELKQPCKVVMDLGGPKLRTAALKPGPAVLKWSPQRNEHGQVLAPARIWLTDEKNPLPPPAAMDAVLPVVDNWQADLRQGDRVMFRDARGRERRLKIVQELDSARVATCKGTAYLLPNTVLSRRPSRGRRRKELVPPSLGRVGALPATEVPITIRVGDVLVLTRPIIPGEPARRDRQNRVAEPAHIGCTLPEVFRDLRVGERVMLDDGKIGGTITAASASQVTIKIHQARARGARLRGDRGINLPDSSLHLTALTPKDLADLVEVVRLADFVGYSFVRRPEDVHQLQAELARLDGKNLGIMLKIENRQAFEQLPSLLLALMRSPVAGVMIARGDLAIEIGYERLAEVQEEILWMCEAAHLPVIWATQVLESLAKEGVPSRAEITDAAMGVRAECVMLNRGPYIVDAVRVLVNILGRMQEHHSKKRDMLRRLKLAEGLPRPV